MLGYNNVFDMKYGMCSWNDHFASRWKMQSETAELVSLQLQTILNQQPVSYQHYQQERPQVLKFFKQEYRLY
jgi:hypothetical protein